MLTEMLLLHLGDVAAVIANYHELVAAGDYVLDDYWFLPAYADFRSHPGFATLLETVGLPAYWDQSGWPEFCRRGDDGTISCS
jgi:hypothetical protein